MTRFVIDASLALSWCFEDESDPYADEVLSLITDRTELVVPQHWGLEVTNGLLIAERRNCIDRAGALRAALFLGALPLSADRLTLPRAFGPTLDLAIRYGLTTYDAAYLELALREALPLASLDADLLRAASMSGVPVVKG